jgi:peroxiredoxin Q/BCP
MGILNFLGVSLSQAELNTGDPVPDITATDHTGMEIKFSEYCKDGLVLVFFYPKADTPGCTKQACSLRDSYPALTAKGVKILGVSFDKAESQKAFAEKFALPYPLLADPDGKVVKAFGVPEMGKFAKRQAYLIKDGKVVWRDLAASTDKQAADVLAAIESL